jgi:four helix bundle protein
VTPVAALSRVSSFEDLIAYQRAAALADDLRAIVKSWSAMDQWTVGVQLVRCADSVGANIAEAFGRGTSPDQLRFLLFARGSAYELQHWIERAISRSLIREPATYRARAGEVGKLVNGLHRAHRAKSRATSN